MTQAQAERRHENRAVLWARRGLLRVVSPVVVLIMVRPTKIEPPIAANRNK